MTDVSLAQKRLSYYRNKREKIRMVLLDNSDINTFGILTYHERYKRIFKQYFIKYFNEAQDNTKRNAGIEILEDYVISKYGDQITEEGVSLSEVYLDYIKYSDKRSDLYKILESYSEDISGIQSELKVFSDIIE